VQVDDKENEPDVLSITGASAALTISDVPWAHLDIAGPAFSDSGDGPLVPKGATGFGVRTLVAYLEALG
jgi:leucyl aminopeptidase